MNKTTPETILALLPQTQCRKCGYSCCRDYATAIAEGAAINCCLTGGIKGIRRLSRLTGKPFIPLNPQYGEEYSRNGAVIDESSCLGCASCINICPVDAIIGAKGFTHTVLPSKCTGCHLCLSICPVDSIMIKHISGKTGWDAWSLARARRARTHYELRQERLAREEKKEHQRLEAHAKTAAADHEKKDIIRAAIEKARARSIKDA